jgi:hypothetical protein
MKLSSLIAVSVGFVLLFSCAVGHEDFNDYRNKEIGTVIAFKEVFKFENAGKLKRADFVITGKGLTHITKDEQGNLIYHFSDQEVLPNAPTKEWVGKCLFYYIVDSNTYVIKEWGF